MTYVFGEVGHMLFDFHASVVQISKEVCLVELCDEYLSRCITVSNEFDNVVTKYE